MWILDLSTGRSHVVRVGRHTPSPLILNTIATQGCVLSLLLYSLYTHNCVVTFDFNTIFNFSDDTAVVVLIPDNNENAYLREVKDLAYWCQDNDLLLKSWW